MSELRHQQLRDAGVSWHDMFMRAVRYFIFGLPTVGALGSGAVRVRRLTVSHQRSDKKPLDNYGSDRPKRRPRGTHLFPV